MKEAEKLTGEVCIYVQYNYRFSDEERIRRVNKILRKNVVEHNGNNNDWDAL